MPILTATPPATIDPKNMSKPCKIILTPEMVKEAFEVLKNMPSIRIEYSCNGDMYYYENNKLIAKYPKGHKFNLSTINA